MIARRTLLAVLPLLVGLAAPAWAQTIRWDLTNEYQPNSLIGQGNAFFAEKVKELSGGRILITNHFNGALGFKSKDVLDAVGRGAVPLGDASTIFWGGIEPIFQLSGLPFLTTDADQSRRLFEAAKPFYEKVLAKHNQYLLFVSPWPPSGIWSRRPLENVASLRGLKIRTYDPASTNTFRAAGAAPQQLAWADVIPLLATNGIDAVLTSADGGASAKFWEHVTHFTEANYAMPLSMATINKDEFDKLKPEDKKIVRDAAAATQDRQWAGLRTRVAENYAEMRAKGMTLSQSVSPDIRQAFAQAADPVVQEWATRMGDDGRAILDTFKRQAPSN
jgi:TRAP-type C4-dicarboxylate transport system substrate-binding protein